MIYLDNNATTQLDERVLEVMQPFFRSFYANPSSLHKLGRLSRGAVETAREQVAGLVGTSPAQVVFTSGGTESNNLAIKGFSTTRPNGRIVIGATEHASLIEPATALEQDGWAIDRLSVDSDGIFDTESVEKCIGKQPVLASLMHANNETGVIQDISALVDRFRCSSIPVHSDAVQAIGKIPVNFEQSGLNLMSVSAHKIFGPKGAGALIVDKSMDLQAILHGGGQEKGLRGGTENVAAIVGFGKAAELARSEMQTRSELLMKLRIQLEQGLATNPAISIFSKNVARLPNTVMFGANNIDGEMMVMELDRSGIAVSSGSACNSKGNEPSPVLSAMGVTPDLAKSAVRVSLGPENTAQEIEQFLDAIVRLVPKNTLEENI